MNTNQAQSQASGGQQPPSQQPNRPILFRPEQMRNLPEQFSVEEKQKWENGLNMLYKTMEKNPPDSKEYMDARKKIADFSNTLRGKLQLARQQASQGQPQPPNQAASSQSQTDTAAPSQGTTQPARQMGSQQKQPSQHMLHHINTFPYVIPPEYAPGSPEAAKWLQESKTKYGKALMAMESTGLQLRNLETMVKQRNEQGKPLNENEQKDYTAKKEQLQKGYSEAKRWSDSFRKQQEQQNELASQGKATNATSGNARPALNANQQTPNTAQQNTETVNAAIQAARNQQIQGGKPSGPANGQPPQQNEPMSQAPSAQSMNATALPSSSQASGNQGANIKVEGAAQPQVNTAVAAAMQQSASRQQNSPHSAIPQSATSAGPPRPLSHPAALAQAARTYSSTQTSGTPNVMGAASHAHPSIPREAPNINTNKMPIPKQLPPGAIAPPQPVPMPPSRPTISGGPANAGSGLMGQPVLQKTPGFNLEGEGERVMNKRKLDELVRQVTGGGEGLDSGEGLTPEVEDCVLTIADEFVDQVITAACKCAKARGSKTLEIRDIQLILERNYNIRIPGYASDEIRTVRKFQPAQGWIAKMSAIQAAKVTGGKGDL